MRDKALRVLRSDSIPYDPTHALILCSTYRFTLGLVLLWEKMGMYEDVLRSWMDQHKEGGAGADSSGASAKVIDHRAPHALWGRAPSFVRARVEA